MKIAHVETIWISIPFNHGGPSSGFFAHGVNWNNLDTLIVKVETDTGLIGYGEAFGYACIPATKAALDHMIAPRVVGQDATRIAHITETLQRSLHNFGRYGPTLFAISGLDIALWDIAGKAAGLPLHRLLGGPAREKLPVYASLLRYRDPAAVSDRTHAAVNAGYKMVKLHEIAAESVQAARIAAGDDVAIMVDTNCPWTVAEAIDHARQFQPFAIHWLEEPVWPPENFRGLAEVRAKGGTAIAAGENACTAWEFQAMLSAGAVDFAQPSVTKVGGITEFRKVMALCETHNVRLAPHSPYFGPGFLATCQLMAAQSGPIERYFGTLEASLYGDLVNPINGHLELPAGPGLGADPAIDVIRTYLVRAG